MKGQPDPYASAPMRKSADGRSAKSANVRFTILAMVGSRPVPNSVPRDPTLFVESNVGEDTSQKYQVVPPHELALIMLAEDAREIALEFHKIGADDAELITSPRHCARDEPLVFLFAPGEPFA